MTKDEALKLALAFAEDVHQGEWSGSIDRRDDVCSALKEALAQPEHEQHDSEYECSHDVWVQHNFSFDGETIATIYPVVRMANDYDGFCVQNFHSRDEVEEMVSKLRAAAVEAWGEYV